MTFEAHRSLTRVGISALVWLAGTCHAATFEVLHAFDGINDGASPFGALGIDQQGTLYGTTTEQGPGGCGTFFKLSPRGFETLHPFSCDATDLGAPYGSLLVSPEGGVVGTATAGGPQASGGVFQYRPSTGYSVLLFINCPDDGCSPTGGLVTGVDGALYGTAMNGGQGNGTIFRIDPATATLTKLHELSSADGAYPQATLGRVGNTLYGTAWLGGKRNGNPFAIDTDGSNFKAIKTTRGALFYSGMARDKAQRAWGAAENGGTPGHTFGGLYTVSPNGAYTWEYSLQGGEQGSTPYGTPLIGADGAIYGTTYVGGSVSCNCGTVFRYDPVSRVHTVLHTFTGHADGGGPVAGLVQGGDGKLYGVTTGGGRHKSGVVFRVTP